MAEITVSDALKARLQARLGRGLDAYVEQVLTDELACEDDPDYRSAVASRIDTAVAELHRGEHVDIDEARRSIARDCGIRDAR